MVKVTRITDTGIAGEYSQTVTSQMLRTSRDVIGGHMRKFYVAALLVCGFTLPTVEATEFYVAVDQPNASDANDGRSLDHPFKSLSRGVQSLFPGDTLSIKAGIYREPLEISRSGTASSPIVIRAYPGDEGNVVIRGSDVVKSWTNDGGDVWSLTWHPLPRINYPEGWPDVDEYSRRREMVFINGTPLTQVLSQSALVSGRFWMDDAAQRMRVHYSGNPNSSLVEISVRDQGVIAVTQYDPDRVRAGWYAFEGEGAACFVQDRIGPTEYRAVCIF